MSNTPPPKSSPQDHPANPSAETEKEKPKMIQDGPGTTLYASLKTPDPAGWSSNNHWAYLIYQTEALTGYCTTLKPYTTPHGRTTYQLQTSDPRHSEKEYSYWPTPLATDAKGGCKHPANDPKRQRKRDSYLRHKCYTLGRPDLAKSAKFRLKLMGFPTDYLDEPTDSPPSETL